MQNSYIKTPKSTFFPSPSTLSPLKKFAISCIIYLESFVPTLMKGWWRLPRNNPRVKFATTLAKVLADKLQLISSSLQIPKTQLVDESVSMLVDKYKQEVIATEVEGADIFMAKTIAICSNKGGVGKTTSTAALADLLGRKDYHVLVIDVDPQGNLSKRFGYDPKMCRSDIQLSAVVRNVLSDKARPLKEFVLKTQNKNVDIIPNDDRFEAAKKELLDQVMMGINAYKIILQELSTDYDFILLDCRPAVDAEIAQIMQAIDYILIPVLASDDSADGVTRTLGYANICHKANPNLKVAGVFFSAVDNRTAVSHDYVPQIREAFGGFMFQTVIPKSEDARKAEAGHVPVSEGYPSGKCTRAYSKLLEEVLSRLG